MPTLTEDNKKRLNELVNEYKEKKNGRAIVRLIGGGVNDLQDYLAADEGEAPAGADNK